MNRQEAEALAERVWAETPWGVSVRVVPNANPFAEEPDRHAVQVQPTADGGAVQIFLPEVWPEVRASSFPNAVGRGERPLVLERLAALEHEQWAHWTRHLLDHSTPENVRRWRRQVETPYAELSEDERERDRAWARKVLGLLDAAWCEHRAHERALADVLRERERQDATWGEQNHDPALHLRFGGPEAEGLRTELVQATAVGLAMIECLDRGTWQWGRDRSGAGPADR